jgi:molecular chaperone DnaK
VEKSAQDRVDAAAKELKAALDGKDAAVIREKTEALKKVLQEVGASLYQQTQKQAASEPQQGPQGNVSDADYKVKDEGKQ